MTRFGYVMTTYFCVLGIGIASFLPVPLRLVWNASASVPIGLYGLEPPRGLRVGELIAVAPSRHLADFMAERGYLGRGVPLMKHVSALRLRARSLDAQRRSTPMKLLTANSSGAPAPIGRRADCDGSAAPLLTCQHLKRQRKETPHAADRHLH